MAGTVVLTSQRTEGVVKRAIVTCTGDAADGTFPETTLVQLGLYIDGTILAVQTNPGGTSPDDNYDVLLVDGDGLDRFGGAVLNRDAATSERVLIGPGAYASLGEALTLTITGNAVISAEVVVTIYHTARAVTVAETAAVSDVALLAAVNLIGAAVQMEDDAHVSTDSGMVLLAVTNEAGADLVGTDLDYTVPATTIKGAMYVRPSIRLITREWTPTLPAATITAGDNMYTTLYEITDAARHIGGTGRIVDFFCRDGDLQSKAHVAHIFDRSVTIPAGDAAWSISDADNKFRACAPLNSGVFSASALNSTAGNPSLAVPFQCKSDSASLFVAVVTLEAWTATASGATFGLRIEQD